MLKKLSLFSICTILSFPTFAKFEELPILTIKDKDNTVRIFVDLEIGHMPYGSEFGMRNDNEITDCTLELGAPAFAGKPKEGDWSFKEEVDSYIDYQIIAVSKKDFSYTIVLELKINETLSVAPAIQVASGCWVANDVVTTTTVRWAGDVEFDKPIHVKLPKDNELTLELKKELSDEDNAL